jgi:YD repeat-containing protein
VSTVKPDDSLNRLTLVAESGGNSSWQEGYTYDQYGNLMTVPVQTNVQAPAFLPSVSTQIDTSHNRVVRSTSAQTTNDVQYDDAGNVKVFPVMSGQMTYDAENRLTSFQTSTGGTATYAYDGQDGG